MFVIKLRPLFFALLMKPLFAMAAISMFTALTSSLESTRDSPYFSRSKSILLFAISVRYFLFWLWKMFLLPCDLILCFEVVVKSNQCCRESSRSFVPFLEISILFRRFLISFVSSIFGV